MIEIQKKIEIKHHKQLLVEGVDEAKFFVQLLDYMHVSDVQVIPYKGKDNHKEFKNIFQTPNFPNIVVSIGIIRDADENDPISAFQSICNALKQLSIAQPDKMNVFTDAKPRIGIFILPDCKNSGMIEDILLNSLNEKPEMECVDSFLTCMKKYNCEFKNPAKNRIKSWLASRKEVDYGLGLGISAEKKYWNFDHPAFSELANFIKNI